MASLGARIRLGVIADARDRHRRHRWYAYVAVLLLVVASITVASAARGGGGRVRFDVPAPGRVTGSLKPLPAADYQVWATPSLLPDGIPGLSLAVQTVGGWSEWATETVFPDASAPIVWGQGDSVRAPLPVGGNGAYVMIVGNTVAAVRVGALGTAAAVRDRAMPPGTSLVAFRVPQAGTVKNPGQSPAQTLTMLDRAGYPIATIAPPRRHALRPQPRQARWTVHGGACAVASSLSGAHAQLTVAARSVTALPAHAAGIFVSCLDDRYAYGRSRFNVAILLNAHHPGQPPAPIWNATPVHGNPGIFELAPPSQLPPNQDMSAPLYARRITNAWLIVQARPGFAPNPSSAVRVRLLDSLRISRLAVSQAR